MKALDNECNSHLLELTSEKIKKMNWDILQQLHLSREDTKDIMKKLKQYRYVDGMNELKYGTFIRWIPIVDPDNIYLTTPAIFCEFKVKKEGVCVVYKTFKGKYSQSKMDECLLFQKITDQEMVLLSALDHLST
jgi:hypothetical protein